MSNDRKYLGFAEDKNINGFEFTALSFSKEDVEKIVKLSEANEKGYVNMSIVSSRSGKKMCTAYDPKNVIAQASWVKESNSATPAAAPQGTPVAPPQGSSDADSLPF